MTDLSGYEPNIEAIAAYDPDLVVSPTEPSDLWSARGPRPGRSWVGEPAVTLDDVYAQIEQLGAATGHVAEAAELVGRDADRHRSAGQDVPASEGDLVSTTSSTTPTTRSASIDVHRSGVRPGRAGQHRRSRRRRGRRVPAAVSRVHHRGRSRPHLPGGKGGGGTVAERPGLGSHRGGAGRRVPLDEDVVATVGPARRRVPPGDHGCRRRRAGRRHEPEGPARSSSASWSWSARSSRGCWWVRSTSHRHVGSAGCSRSGSGPPWPDGAAGDDPRGPASPEGDRGGTGRGGALRSGPPTRPSSATRWPIPTC